MNTVNAPDNNPTSAEVWGTVESQAIRRDLSLRYMVDAMLHLYGENISIQHLTVVSCNGTESGKAVLISVGNHCFKFYKHTEDKGDTQYAFGGYHTRKQLDQFFYIQDGLLISKGLQALRHKREAAERDAA